MENEQGKSGSGDRFYLVVYQNSEKEEWPFRRATDDGYVLQFVSIVVEQHRQTALSNSKIQKCHLRGVTVF